LLGFAVTVLTFFIAGLLYLLRFERVDILGAYSIPSETGLLIPSGFASWASTQNGPVMLGLRKMKPSNSSSGGIQGDVGQARDRNGNEQVRPQSESASQIRY
jgi:hypothetical protein